MIVFQPVKRILYEKISDFIAVTGIEIHRLAPWRLVFLGKIVPVIPEIISLRTHMVVDNIQIDCHAFFMTGIHQLLKLPGAAIRILHRERIDPVISPVPPPWELRHRHQFNGIHFQRFQLIQSRYYRRKCSFRGERSHMEFVNHHIFERNILPIGIGPRKRGMINYL